MNLLGLMLGDVLSVNLASATHSALVAKLKGAIGITAGNMSITLRFASGQVIVSRGLSSDLTSQVMGTLNTLLQVSLGRSVIRSFLTGDISFSGNPFFLLKVLPLLRSGLSIEESKR